jgi:amino acid adenylation domain-containing protein
VTDTLAARFSNAAARHGERTAAADPARSATITYGELDVLAERLAGFLREAGVGPGDRVGVAGKSIPLVAAILAIHRVRAAYVPVDAHAPAARGATILADCGVRGTLAAPEFASALATELGTTPSARGLPAFDPLGPELHWLPGPAPSSGDPELAYVLYTSGSTGKPKGVVHTHASALAFVDWCSETFQPDAEDRFSSHAPFHFDLSILDLFVPQQHGAAVILIEEELGKQPVPLAKTIAEQAISVWYSTPSILSLLVEFGRLERQAYPALRIVCFAGEVFPIGTLRRLKAIWPAPRYFNLYGPTETNVCTYFELPAEIPAARTKPFPIGTACSDDRTLVVDGERRVARGEEGELLVAGGSVMRGYWNLRERTASAFWIDAGTRWYRTGDLVVEQEDGNLVYLGRRDRMVKRRGYRIEPGEIEAALHRHPLVREAAVLGRTEPDGSTTLHAFLAVRDGAQPSIVELKQWCAANLPMYMIPDRFRLLDALPKTSTDKVDYQTLAKGE